MSKQHAATILATVGTAEPLSSKRVPKATKRFVEGWFSASLPRLSLALGVGVAGEEDADHSRAEGEASSGEVSTPLALGSHTDEETQTPGVVEEVGDDTPIGTSEKRRSVRVRRATKRFEEGWFSASLPRLSSALSVAVADRKES